MNDDFSRYDSEEFRIEDLDRLPEIEGQFDEVTTSPSLASTPSFDGGFGDEEDESSSPPSLGAGPSLSAQPERKAVDAKDIEKRFVLASGLSEKRLRNKLRNNRKKRAELGKPLPAHENDPYAQLLRPLTPAELRNLERDAAQTKLARFEQHEKWAREEEGNRNYGFVFALLFALVAIWRDKLNYLEDIAHLQMPRALEDRLPEVLHGYEEQTLFVVGVFAPILVMLLVARAGGHLLRAARGRRRLRELSLATFVAVATWLTISSLSDRNVIAVVVICLGALLADTLLSWIVDKTEGNRRGEG